MFFKKKKMSGLSARSENKKEISMRHHLANTFLEEHLALRNLEATDKKKKAE